MQLCQQFEICCHALLTSDGGGLPVQELTAKVDQGEEIHRGSAGPVEYSQVQSAITRPLFMTVVPCLIGSKEEVNHPSACMGSATASAGDCSMELRPLTIDNCERTLARGLRRWSRCQNEASLEGVSVRLEELPGRARCRCSL